MKNPSSLASGACCFLVVATLGCGEAPPPTPEVEIVTANTIEAKARRIHHGVLTLDTHNDINVKNFTVERNYTMDLDTQVNLPKMRQGGLDVSWMIVYTGQKALDEAGYATAYTEAMEKFEAIHRLTEEIAPDQIELALTSADARRIHESGKLVAMIGIENGYPVGLDLDNVRRFAQLGGRYMSLAHNGHSQLSDSNTGERDGVWLHDGLSDLGRQAVAAMNRWGIMVDVSHPSRQAMLDMMEITKAPVIASHSAARALCDHSRNLDDEQLLLIKENGGVVQTVAFSSYVDSEKHDAHKALEDPILDEIAAEMGFERKPWSELRGLEDAEIEAYIEKLKAAREQAKPRIAAEVDPIAPPVNVADFVDHIDHIVDLIGIDHVGISSDFDGGGGVSGWNDASETFNVTLELVKRGYDQEQIAKLWSGNLLRVLDETQRIAAEIQAADPRVE